MRVDGALVRANAGSSLGPALRIWRDRLPAGPALRGWLNSATDMRLKRP